MTQPEPSLNASRACRVRPDVDAQLGMGLETTGDGVLDFVAELCHMGVIVRRAHTRRAHTRRAHTRRSGHSRSSSVPTSTRYAATIVMRDTITASSAMTTATITIRGYGARRTMAYIAPKSLG